MICTQSEGVLTDCPQRPALSLFVAPTKSRETARRERAERCLCRVTAARDKAINPTQHLTGGTELLVSECPRALHTSNHDRTLQRTYTRVPDCFAHPLRA